jgi:putative ABC transport system permease protein
MQILALILGQGVRLLVFGLTIGLAGALLFSRLLHDFLFEASAIDPLTYMGGALLLALAALVACWFPARRAARIDPIIALRAE